MYTSFLCYLLIRKLSRLLLIELISYLLNCFVRLLACVGGSICTQCTQATVIRWLIIELFINMIYCQLHGGKTTYLKQANLWRRWSSFAKNSNFHKSSDFWKEMEGKSFIWKLPKPSNGSEFSTGVRVSIQSWIRTSCPCRRRGDWKRRLEEETGRGDWKRRLEEETGRGDWKRRLEEETGRGDWKRRLEEETGRGDWKRRLEEETGRGDWKRRLEEETGRGDWKRRLEEDVSKFLRKVLIRLQNKIKLLTKPAPFQLPIFLHTTPGERVSVSTILSIRCFTPHELESKCNMIKELA